MGNVREANQMEQVDTDVYEFVHKCMHKFRPKHLSGMFVLLLDVLCS